MITDLETAVAFLVHAWERVSANKGAKTAGVDKVTAAMVATWVGVEAFLGQIRDSLKSGEFRPAEARQVMIPKGRRSIAVTSNINQSKAHMFA